MNQSDVKPAAAQAEKPVRRRWVTYGRALGAFVLLILIMPVGIRWYRLWCVPDVPTPFDVDEFLSFPYPEDENAYLYFQRAAFLGQGIRHRPELSLPFHQQGKTFAWTDVPEDVRPWVPRGGEALEIFRQGARCPAGSFHTPRSAYNASASLPDIRLDELYWLALLESLRQLDEGHPQQSAEILHDAFRASRLWGRGGWLNERSRGVFYHNLVAIGWHEWSRHPDVSAEELEAALARLRDDWKLTRPMSDILKVDHLIVLNEAKLPLALLRKEWHSDIDRWWRTHVLDERIKPDLDAWETKVPGWQIPILWTLGEPEIMVRGAKLRLTHDLKTCDLPLAEQPPATEFPFHLGRTDELTAGLTADELNERLQLSPLLWHLGAAPSSLQHFIRPEEAQQRLLETELELQILFRRNHVASRADVENALKEYTWPVDPCARDGAAVRHRATDDGLLIWSLGRDLIDQNGVSDPDQFGTDILIRIPWPASP